MTCNADLVKWKNQFQDCLTLAHLLMWNMSPGGPKSPKLIGKFLFAPLLIGKSYTFSILYVVRFRNHFPIVSDFFIYNPWGITLTFQLSQLHHVWLASSPLLKLLLYIALHLFLYTLLPNGSSFTLGKDFKVYLYHESKWTKY